MHDHAVSFAPFTQAHAIALAWTAALLSAALIAGRLTRNRPAQRRLDAAIAWFAIGVNIFSLAYFATPPRLSWAQSLPLQLCDLACLLAPVALLKPSARWARTLVYFWGLGLSSQAFLTPTLTEGFPSLRYWQFWLLHLVIVGTAVYDVLCRGYRPTMRDLRLAVAVSVVWFALVFALNILLARLGVDGANYGYNADTRPENPTIIDALGAWPARALWLMLIGVCVLTLWWGIWPAGRWLVSRLGPRQADAPAR
jgi:hypothetical integral membrane protein (TIGR02206 family)